MRSFTTFLKGLYRRSNRSPHRLRGRITILRRIQSFLGCFALVRDLASLDGTFKAVFAQFPTTVLLRDSFRVYPDFTLVVQ
jgi:hypothetical protein